MLTPFLCGSFHHQEQEDEDMDQWSLPSTPKKISKRNSFYKSKEPKNPYSGRGLDKFSALLADLDDKRRKIYTQKGSEDISLVRFVYTNPNTPKPIIVKVKDKQDKVTVTVDISKDDSNNLSMPKSPVIKQVEEHKTYPKWKLFTLVDWRRPSFYLPVFIILILFFLAIFGRSFTILCTSIGWYLVPTINGGVSKTRNSKRPKKKKKEFSRKSSDVKVASNFEGISSPTTRMNGVSPRQHGQRKSL